MTDIILLMGSTAAIAAHTGTAGTLAINTDNQALYLFDGVTQGGKRLHGEGPALIQALIDNLGISDIAGLSAALANKVELTQIGVASGVAPLDENGKIAAEHLPAYVDDVIDIASESDLPETGEADKFYVAVAENTLWRWTGSGYMEMRATPYSTDELVEGELNQYFTATRVHEALSVDGDLTFVDGVLGYEAPEPVTKSSLGLGEVENLAVASQEEAEAGESNERYMTPLRVAQFILKMGLHYDVEGATWVWDEGEMGFSDDIQPLTAFSSDFEGDVPVPDTIVFYGTTAENDALTLEAGQVAVDTERNTLRLHDGVTQGGFELPYE